MQVIVEYSLSDIVKPMLLPFWLYSFSFFSFSYPGLLFKGVHGSDFLFPSLDRILCCAIYMGPVDLATHKQGSCKVPVTCLIGIACGAEHSCTICSIKSDEVSYIQYNHQNDQWTVIPFVKMIACACFLNSLCYHKLAVTFSVCTLALNNLSY